MEFRGPSDTRSKRQSLRDSVLKRPKNERQAYFPSHDEQQDQRDLMRPGAPQDFFRELDSFFGDRGDNLFSPFGFSGFGSMDRFGEHFNEMMSRFFSDFQPESFSDSQYYKEDRDLDQDVDSRGLDRTLDSTPRFNQPNVHYRGYSHSESIIAKPDGTVEKRVTRKDGDGNEETVVTITHPDGNIEITTDGDPGAYSQEFGNFSMSDHDSTLIISPGFTSGLFQMIFDNLKRFF